MKRLIVALAAVVVLVGVGQVEGAVLDFDGNDRVVVPDSPSLNPSEITVECRVNFARLSTNWPASGVRAQELVSKGFDDVPGQFSLRQDSHPQNLQFLIDDKADWAWARASVPLVVDQWYHIAGTYDGDTLQLYVDGVLVASNLVGSHQLGNSSPLYFSHHDRPGYEYPLAGQMDDVVIWNYARSAAELQATMAGDVLTGLEAGLVGYWDFDEDTDNQTVFDATANANHGQLGSTPGVDDHDPSRIGAADPIPEPSTILIWSLLGIIGITVGWCRRRRKAA